MVTSLQHITSKTTVTPSLQHITSFLEKYKHVFGILGELEDFEDRLDLAYCEQLTLEHVIDENDYYGCDFTKHRILVLHMDGSNFFTGFLIGPEGTEFESILDQLPLYYFGLGADCGEFPPALGNFKTFMSNYVQASIKYLTNYEDGQSFEDSDYLEANESCADFPDTKEKLLAALDSAAVDLEQFSSNLIDAPLSYRMLGVEF